MYGLKRLNSATLFTAAAAEIYRKRLSSLRSIPICGSSHRSLSATAGFGMSRNKTHKRKKLPAELSKDVAMLTCESAARGGVCDVYLVGTKHNTKESCEQVKAVIRFLKPQAVFIELCPSRAKHLAGDKEKSAGEFSVAYEEAMKCGAKVILGDRSIGITYRRFSVMAFVLDLCTLHLRTKPTDDFKGLLKKVLGKADAGTVNHIKGFIARIFPSFYKTFFHERDQYMATKLLEVACKHNSVVVVVGKGHVQGIQQLWKQPVDMKQLLHVPIGKRMFTTPGGIGATAAIISGIYLLKDVISC